jgi:hypothetical protein
MSNQRFHITVLLGALCLTLACDEGQPETIEGRSASIDSNNSIDPIPRSTVEAAVEAAPESVPPPATGSLRDQLMVLQPQKTRAGWVRFTDPVINNPEAAAILLERLLANGDAPEVRAALAEALGRTRGDYATEVSELLASEADARVREMLVGTLGRQAPTPEALVGLATGLKDSTVEVRAAAARTIATRSDGVELGDELIGMLVDVEPSVRSEAARTLGILQIDEATQPLVELLADANAEVRLDALRAVHRIDPEYALALPVLAQLEQDGDDRVKRLATKIRG